MKTNLLLFLFLLNSTLYAQWEDISGVWYNTAILNQDNDRIKETTANDHLSLNQDGSFYYFLQKESIYASGTAAIQDTQLVLTYRLVPGNIGVDSATVFNNHIAYFLNGSVIRKLQASELYADSLSGSINRLILWKSDSLGNPFKEDYKPQTYQRTYHIEKHTVNELIFSENNIQFAYVRNPQFKPAVTGFSFWGIFKALIALTALVVIGFLLSEKKRAIKWPLIFKGLLFQFVLAVLILKVPYVEEGFEWLSALFVKVISFAEDGARFLFAAIGSGEIESPLLNFAVIVLPTIIFFSALTAMFYYWGILQKVVYAFAWLMKRIMKLSGAESLAAAGNIFLGQTESPLLVRPYLASMSRSEIMCLMTGGMATIAGGVLAAYIGFLGGGSELEQLFFAKHLLTASVMSAPAAIVAAKLLVPETEQFNQTFRISKERLGSNLLEAISNGTSDGLKLAVNVAAMLLVFIATISLGNFLLSELIGETFGLNNWIQSNTNYDGLSFQFIIGHLFAPLAWLMGVHADDIVLVGQLLGEKTILNEFYAYITLGDMKSSNEFTDGKSIIISTYILCGFANFASIGIQIGGIGALIPNRKTLLSSLGLKALIAGTIACLFTAAIVGMFYQ